jgi:hypothetical protein
VDRTVERGLDGVFVLDGPEKCSGLPGVRYSVETLSVGLGLGVSDCGIPERAAPDAVGCNAVLPLYAVLPSVVNVAPDN